MNWTELLKTEIETTYRVAQNLIGMVDEDRLDWKPPTGSNWMTTAQLLCHLANACGMPFRGFVTGDWGMPEGGEAGGEAPEEMLLPAEKLPAVQSVAEARRMLGEDKQLALDMLARCSEERLANEPSTAPWDPTGIALGYRLLQMVDHLDKHKGQLFYYLKLQGKPVNTSHLWG